MNPNLVRQNFLGPDMHDVLANATLGIIGLCGGGSHVAQQAAHAGFQKFVISDYDIVEDSNLNRMVGSRPSDAHEKALKTNVIERQIHSINPLAHVISVADEWQNGELHFRDCSVIVACGDNLSVRDGLERFCRRYLIPLIDIGMDVHTSATGFAISGQVILSLPEKPCMRCMGFITNEKLAKEQAKYGAAGGHPQVVWPNGVLASVAIGQLMNLLLPWSTDTPPALLVEYDGNRQQLKESSKLRVMGDYCLHYGNPNNLGDPYFSRRFAKKSVRQAASSCC
jgi:molybdopterin/thiamine biosynthesis adenylyltransferase